MYKYYNPNPVGRSVGDCSVRAVAKALENKSMDEIIDIFDELLEAVEITNPRLYRKVAEKLQ